MKVNIIIPFTGLTGGIRVIFLYANYLIERGHDVEVYVPMRAYKFNKNFITWMKSIVGNTIKRRNKVDWFNCKFNINLVPSIREIYIRSADISIATAWPTAVDVNNMAKEKGKKVYFIQDYEIWSGKKEEVDLTYKLPMNRIVITRSLQTLLLEKFNVDSTIIYNGLDENEFNISKKVKNNKKIILMLYNEAPNKGTKEGIEILKYIEKQYNAKIILFGYKKGKLAPEEFEFYEKPDRNTLMNLYKQADIYLFPSNYESWGLPVMEAMSNKCAVVGRNVGCLKEIAINNKNAIVVDDYENMKLELDRLLNDDDLLNSIQESAYELADSFKWNKSFKQFEEALLKLSSEGDWEI